MGKCKMGCELTYASWIFVTVLYGFLISQSCSQLVETDFAPQVSATCKGGRMNIKVAFNGSFQGAVHARDFRSPACMAHGDGGHLLALSIDLQAPVGSSEYCGPLVNNKTEERSLPIAVRIHRTLELADDKFYVITCGKASFRNGRNETSLVSLRLLDEEGRKVTQAVYTRPYTLRAEISRPDGKYGFRVKSCFAFNKHNMSAPIVDERGCATDSAVLGEFRYDENRGVAEAEVKSMFRLPDSADVHIQCDIGLCLNSCPPVQCSASAPSPLLTPEGLLMAATSVYVLDPGQSPVVQELCDDGIHPAWLLWLAIALGVLFLLMLVVNVFLCSAMTCACARTEVIEKDGSVVEEYDPYRSWHGSQYGSSMVSGTR